MSDRVSVSVIVPTLLVEKAIDLIAKYSGDPNEVIEHPATVEGLPLSELVYYEVVDGWLSAMDSEAVLDAANIPYDYSWEATGDAKAGAAHGRILTDGRYKTTSVTEGEEAPFMHVMLGLISEEKLQDLAALITKHAETTHPIPWETQIEPVKKLAAELLLDG